MTFVWLFIWMINGFPQVFMWNSWLIALIVCIVIDIIGNLENGSIVRISINKRGEKETKNYEKIFSRSLV